jgi:hypothetical protein
MSTELITNIENTKKPMHAKAKDNNKQRKNIGILMSEMSGICEPQVQRFYFL